MEASTMSHGIVSSASAGALMRSDQDLCSLCRWIIARIERAKRQITRQLDRRKGDLTIYDDLASELASGPASVHVASLGSCYQNKPSHHCRFCHKLWNLRQAIPFTEGNTRDVEAEVSLWASSFWGRLFGSHRIRTRSISSERGIEGDLLTLVLIPDCWDSNGIFSREAYDELPFLVLYDNDRADRLLCCPRLVSSTFDYEMAKKWLSACNTQHASCGPTLSQNTEITLIDCTNNKLVPLDTSYPYIALSYVWGSVVPTPAIAGTHIPPNTSAVILDAMSLTVGLGFQYLWVDQYCINQNDNEVKMKQIREMDLVYSKAQLTIVAACGESAAHGLPGLSRRSRQRFQDPIDIGTGKIFELGPDARLDAVTAKWSTRGWTFQEAWLSRRLLTFTDRQCYFECVGISCAESLEYSKEVWELDDSFLEFTHLDFGPYSRFDELERILSPLVHVTEIYRILHVYSNRKISFDKDSLNAVAGVLASSKTVHEDAGYATTEAESIRFATLLGIPLMVGSYADHSMLQQTLVTGLSWYHIGSSTRTADNVTIVRRRNQLPSWTWAGWEGSIDHSWITTSPVAFDIAIQNVRVTIAGASPHDPTTRIDISDIDSLMEASTLSFEALEIPHTWLTFNQSLRQWSFCDFPVWVSCTESIQPADLLLGLADGKYRLTLIGYSSEDRTGLVWILRSTRVSHYRTGILVIGTDNPIAYDEATEQLSANFSATMMSFISSASAVSWNID